MSQIYGLLKKGSGAATGLQLVPHPVPSKHAFWEQIYQPEGSNAAAARLLGQSPYVFCHLEEETQLGS